MKNLIEKLKGGLMFSAVIFLAASCAKEVEICIAGDMSPDVPGTYVYTWCGKNAENIEWKFNGTTYAGESVSLDLNQKKQYYLEVKGKGKRKEATESFAISVGQYEIRVEPTLCGGDYVPSYGTYKAYLYSDKTNFQVDFRNNTKSNCIDSVELTQSFYYGGTMNELASMTGAFNKTIPTGDYIVYVLRTDGGPGGMNNLHYLFLYNSNLSVMANGSDDVSYVVMNTLNSPSDNTCFNNLFSKTFALTDVWLNGSNLGVSPCNSDDELIFNIDGSWQLDVGADDCSGGQSNSTGSFYGSVYCQSAQTITYSATTSAGSMPASFTFIPYCPNQVKLTAYDGSYTLETIYTAQ
jgi:hypothetical protein